MLRVLAEFWPVFLPLAMYMGWMMGRQQKAKRRQETVPALHEGPWIWAVLTTVLLMIGCFLWLGLSGKADTTPLEQAHFRDGKLVPGHRIEDSKTR